MSALPAFRRLPALERLTLRKGANALLPRLLASGLPIEDAAALAHNAALLAKASEPPFASPRAVLESLTLREIAERCELYRQAESGEIEYGEVLS